MHTLGKAKIYQSTTIYIKGSNANQICTVSGVLALQYCPLSARNTDIILVLILCSSRKLPIRWTLHPCGCSIRVHTILMLLRCPGRKQINSFTLHKHQLPILVRHKRTACINFYLTLSIESIKRGCGPSLDYFVIRIHLADYGQHCLSNDGLPDGTKPLYEQMVTNYEILIKI